MGSFARDFWSLLITSTVLGGLGAGLLYWAIYTFSRIDIMPTLAAVLGGACIAAAYIFAQTAINSAGNS
jgi:hypothetical protein